MEGNLFILCLISRLAGDILKLSYFDLLSTAPVYIENIGVISPTLRSISSIGYNMYQYYLTILLMDFKSYMSMTGHEKQYDLLSDAPKSQINIFELLISNKEICILLQDILNFFIKEDVIYSHNHTGFLIQREDKDIGIITKENYTQICDLICQRNCIKSNQEDDLTKVKSKKALEIMKKLQKGRNEKAKQTKSDKNMELGNIISAVANKSYSLNILNIWDLTVFQVLDCFQRLSNNSIYEIQSMSVATWGDKDNHFDATAWFKKIETNN